MDTEHDSLEQGRDAWERQKAEWRRQGENQKREAERKYQGMRSEVRENLMLLEDCRTQLQFILKMLDANRQKWDRFEAEFKKGFRELKAEIAASAQSR
jgi:hypothetical protein